MNRYIRMWDEDCNDINKIKKIKFNKNINDLFSINNEETLILYEDGTCESLECGLEGRKKSFNADEEKEVVRSIVNPQLQKISKVAFFTTLKGTLITYFVRNESKKLWELFYFLLEKETLRINGDISIIKIQRLEQHATLMSYTVVDGNVFPHLISIWSDKRVFMQQLRYDQAMIHEDPGHFISILNIFNVEQPIIIKGVSKDCIAMYGSNLNQDGASLVLYNTHFKIAQTKQYFKVFFNTSRLWVIGSNIFLAVGQNLSVIPFRISKEQLSDLIGSQRTNELTQSVDQEYINEDDEIEQAISFDAVAQNNLNLVKKIEVEQTIVGPVNGKVSQIVQEQLTSIDDVTDKLRKLYAFDVVFDVVRDKNLLANTAATQIFNNQNGHSVMSEEFELFARELERCGASEYEITEKLIPHIIATKSSKDLIHCLRRYSNISEKTLTSALKYAVSCAEVDEETVVSNGIEKEKISDMEMEIDSKTDYPNVDVLFQDDKKSNFDLLNVVLSCSFDSVNILSYLRKNLDIGSAIFLLKHFNKILTSQNSDLLQNAMSCENFDDDRIILNWACLLIDSHYQQFVLSKDNSICDELTKLLELLREYTDNLKELGSFVPILHNLVQRKVVKNESKYSQWYSIERVKLY